MATEQELNQANAERRKINSCPICGAANRRSDAMRDFDLQIIEFLRTNRITKRDSCIACVEKHFGYAKQLFAELISLKQSNGNPARGSVELNHIEIIGELRAATEESGDYAELYNALLEAERNYRYEGLEPDWLAIAAMIEDVKNNNNNQE